MAARNREVWRKEIGEVTAQKWAEAPHKKNAFKYRTMIDLKFIKNVSCFVHPCTFGCLKFIISAVLLPILCFVTVCSHLFVVQHGIR